MSPSHQAYRPTVPQNVFKKVAALAANYLNYAILRFYNQSGVLNELRLFSF